MQSKDSQKEENPSEVYDAHCAEVFEQIAEALADPEGVVNAVNLIVNNIEQLDVFCDRDERTLLHLAVMYNNIEATEALN